jgi:hypothetical protein
VKTSLNASTFPMSGWSAGLVRTGVCGLDVLLRVSHVPGFPFLCHYVLYFSFP